MNRRPSASLLVLTVLLVTPPLFGGNGGGGHGGGTGHGDGAHGVGSSSGHSFGHSVGHAFGHIFGHRSGGGSARAGATLDSRGNNPGRFGRVGFIHSPARRTMLLRNRLLNSGYCDSFSFSWHNFMFPGEFDCYRNAFPFDSLFYGGSLGTYFWSDSFATVAAEPLGPDEGASSDEPGFVDPSLARVGEPVALLQLLDGSTYGLARYWVEGTRLHYVTNYGGENSVPLERIDFAGTAKLNAAKGTQFDLTRNSHSPSDK